MLHLSTASYSALGIKQRAGKRYLVYTVNDTDSTGPAIDEKTIWLQSSCGFDGINQYFYSTDGKNVTPIAPARPIHGPTRSYARRVAIRANSRISRTQLRGEMLSLVRETTICDAT